ncbi:MAG: hypothetical protein WCK47_04825 [bacterium]|nr:hypothetical protein [Candidatus Sumerlaeota bacterium]
MKRLLLSLTIVVCASLAAAGGCCSNGTYPGPEITGNYGICYLESSDTGWRYSDPMLYHAAGALVRWHSRHAAAAKTARPARTKTYRKTVEK